MLADNCTFKHFSSPKLFSFFLFPPPPLLQPNNPPPPNKEKGKKTQNYLSAKGDSAFEKYKKNEYPFGDHIIPNKVLKILSTFDGKCKEKIG